MHILLNIAICILYWVILFVAFNLGLYKNTICLKDFYRMPKRLLRRLMNKENFAELQIREYQKLRNFIETLDIPMREKESIIWRIESAEKEAITSICKNIQDEALKKLKENL